MGNRTGFIGLSHGKLMSDALAVISIVSSVFVFAGCAEGVAAKTVISPEDFAGSLEYIGIAVKKADTHVWGTSAVIDRETGKVQKLNS